MSSREVDLVKRLKWTLFFAFLRASFKPGKSKKEMRMRGCAAENGGEGGRERQRQAENMRMELSSGYIWGLCDS